MHALIIDFSEPSCDERAFLDGNYDNTQLRAFLVSAHKTFVAEARVREARAAIAIARASEARSDFYDTVAKALQ